MSEKLEHEQAETTKKLDHIFDWLSKSLENDKSWNLLDGGILCHTSKQIRIRTYDQLMQEPIHLDPPRNIRTQIKKLEKLLKQRNTNDELKFLTNLFENDFESSICVTVYGNRDERTAKLTEMQDWLKKNLPSNYDFRVSPFRHRMTIFFYEPADAMAFKLTWE